MEPPYFKLDRVSVTGKRNGSSPVEILKDVSLEIAAGECWTVVGRSGAGKSTFLRLLNRLVEPSGGTVYRSGTPLASIPPATVRREAALVFQEPRWLPGTARDNLFAPVGLKVISRTQAEAQLEKILSLTGLRSDLLDRGEDELSLGQCQRVALARALMTCPRALLLDEPTAAMDPPGARALLDQVLGLGEAENLTMVMVTHRLREARQFGTKTLVLEEGRVVESGTSGEVLSRLEARWEELDEF